MSSKSFALKTLSAVAVCLGSSSLAQAAGFQLLEQNASGLGNAYAGSAAVAENASTIYFNPAGMTYLPGANVSTGVNFICPLSNSTTTAITTTPAQCAAGFPPVATVAMPAI